MKFIRLCMNKRASDKKKDRAENCRIPENEAR